MFKIRKLTDCDIIIAATWQDLNDGFQYKVAQHLNLHEDPRKSIQEQFRLRDHEGRPVKCNIYVINVDIAYVSAVLNWFDGVVVHDPTLAIMHLRADFPGIIRNDIVLFGAVL